MSQWFNIKKPSQKTQSKKLIQNGWVQINLAKMTIWSSWTWGQKDHTRDIFYQNSWSKK
jgi:hypothetical protein